MRQPVFWPFWYFICIRIMIRNKNVLIFNYAQLFVTSYEEKIVNFLKRAYFLAVRTIRFWPSVLRATGFCWLFWEFHSIRKIIRRKHVLIFHYTRKFILPFEKILVSFLKTTYFSVVQTIWFCPSVVHATRCFLNVLGLHMHQEKN